MPGTQPLSLMDYWRTLLKRRWIILSCVVVSVTASALYSFHLKPIYEAAARISVDPENTNNLGFKDDVLRNGPDDGQISLQTQAKILQSDTLALEVIRSLNLQSRLWPSAAGSDKQNANRSVALTGASKLDPRQEGGLIGAFQSSLRVTPLPGTRILEVRFSSTNPDMAAEIANGLVRTYIEHNMKSRFDSTMQAADWLSRQLADLQIKVETSEERLVQYQKQHEILGTDEKQNIVTSKLDELNRDLTAAESERIRKQALYELTVSARPESIGLIVQSDYLQKLAAQQRDLQDQLAQLSSKFGPAFPKVVETKERIEQLQATIDAESTKLLAIVKNDYLGALQKEKMLREAFEVQKQEANQLNESSIQYSLLKRDADSNRQLYEGLLQKLKEASISAGLNSSNIRVVDPARVPTAPSTPNIPRNLRLAFLLGLAGGIVIAFLLDTADTTVHTSEQAEVISGLPSVATIPLNERMLQKGKQMQRAMPLAMQNGHHPEPTALITYSHRGSQIAESYRSLRTSILLSSLGAPPKTILLTSPLPGEGKTTTSVNSALVLAQQGKKVLLVEADLRRPCIQQLFDLDTTVGLSNLLAGTEGLEKAILPSMQPGLFVLPAGPKPPHPAELLGSDLMKQLLDQWSEEFDHIVIDTPPVLSVTDASLLSARVNTVLLVIRSGSTTKVALRRSRDLLLQVNARLMGIVVNAVDLKWTGYYGYSRGKYGYYYHDDHATEDSEPAKVNKTGA